MTNCSFCNQSEVMPFKCKFCNELFCSNHRLPENHECLGLLNFKENRTNNPEEWIYDPFHKKNINSPVGRYNDNNLKEKTFDIIRKDGTKLILYLIIGIIATILVLSAIQLF